MKIRIHRGCHEIGGTLFDRFIQRPPADIDLLLTEATHLPAPGRPPSPAPLQTTEADVERRLLDTMHAAPGMVLVACSAQNLDRVVSVYRRISGMKPVLRPLADGSSASLHAFVTDQRRNARVGAVAAGSKMPFNVPFGRNDDRGRIWFSPQPRHEPWVRLKAHRVS